MKITLSTAMRARDVSRPTDEHLAEAADRDKALARPQEPTPPPRPANAKEKAQPRRPRRVR